MLEKLKDMARINYRGRAGMSFSPTSDILCMEAVGIVKKVTECPSTRIIFDVYYFDPTIPENANIDTAEASLKIMYMDTALPDDIVKQLETGSYMHWRCGRSNEDKLQYHRVLTRDEAVYELKRIHNDDSLKIHIGDEWD